MTVTALKLLGQNQLHTVQVLAFARARRRRRIRNDVGQGRLSPFRALGFLLREFLIVLPPNVGECLKYGNKHEMTFDSEPWPAGQWNAIKSKVKLPTSRGFYCKSYCHRRKVHRKSKMRCHGSNCRRRKGSMHIGAFVGNAHKVHY